MNDASPDQDLADQALAKEFSSYLKEVADQIFEPLKGYRASLEEASQEIQTSAAEVAGGHEATRQKLIGLLEQHQAAARRQAQEQAAWLKTQLEPKLAELTQPLATLIRTLNTQNGVAVKSLSTGLIAHIDNALRQVVLLNESALRRAKEEAAEERAERKRMTAWLRLSVITQGVILVLAVIALLK